MKYNGTIANIMEHIAETNIINRAMPIPSKVHANKVIFYIYVQNMDDLATFS